MRSATISGLLRAVRNVVDAGEARGLHDEFARELQGGSFAGGAPPPISDALEIEIMREAEDATDHLGTGEAKRIDKESIEEYLALHLQPRSAARPGEECERVGIAGRVLAPEAEELGPKQRPDIAHALQHPGAIGIALALLALMTGLRKEIQQQIRDHLSLIHI